MASKIYLRFSLTDVDKKRLDQALLQMTAGRKGRPKLKDNPYKLNVWALNSPLPWDDFAAWSTAPGNDTQSVDGLLAGVATLLTSADLPANPETGDRIQIQARPLLQFLRDYPHDDLTIVLTGDANTDHRAGWRFTSVEDQRFTPPTLILKAK